MYMHSNMYTTHKQTNKQTKQAIEDSFCDTLSNIATNPPSSNNYFWDAKLDKQCLMYMYFGTYYTIQYAMMTDKPIQYQLLCVLHMCVKYIICTLIYM